MPKVELEDTRLIREFMEAFGQTVRTVPTADVTPEERLLRGRLVIEEAFEYLEALGLNFSINSDTEVVHVAPKKVQVEIDPTREINLIEVADAQVDLVVVTKGGSHTFGVPIDDAFLDEVSPSNFAKLGPDGKPILREGDRKVLKPEGWQEPNIAKVLREAGWNGK